MFSALNVAEEINGPDSLQTYITVNVAAEGYFEGKMYIVYEKYDALYPAMKTMYCIGPKGGPNNLFNCFLKIGDSYAIPFLQHSGIIIASL